MPWVTKKAPTKTHAGVKIPGEDMYVHALLARWDALGHLWASLDGPDERPDAGRTAEVDRAAAEAVAVAGAAAYRWGWTVAITGLRPALQGVRRFQDSVMLDPIEMALGIDFTVTNPEAVEWLRRYGFELIREMTPDEMEAVRRAMLEAYQDQRPWRETSRTIAATVPLTALQQERWWRYYDIERLLRPKTAEARANVTGRRMARQRATLIARTETTRASTEGQQALWDRAAHNGWIDPARTGQAWSAAAGSERTCKICGRSHGQVVPLGGEFELDGRRWSGPPAHPNCRCAVVLRFDLPARPRRLITFRKR